MKKLFFILSFLILNTWLNAAQETKYKIKQLLAPHLGNRDLSFIFNGEYPHYLWELSEILLANKEYGKYFRQDRQGIATINSVTTVLSKVTPLITKYEKEKKKEKSSLKMLIQLQPT